MLLNFSSFFLSFPQMGSVVVLALNNVKKHESSVVSTQLDLDL